MGVLVLEGTEKHLQLCSFGNSDKDLCSLRAEGDFGALLQEGLAWRGAHLALAFPWVCSLQRSLPHGYSRPWG